MGRYQLPEEDLSQGMVAEAMRSWGGHWTEEKLDAFEKYVKAYLTIMNSYREKFGWKLLYFDAFAGSGSRTYDESIESPLMLKLFQDDFLTVEQMNTYQGAAERVVKIDNQLGFDKYYFVDLDKESNDKLREKLAPYDKGEHKFEYRNEDANSIIKEMGRFLLKTPNWKALVLLDPFGMNLDWNTIESMKYAGVDLWILVPSGMIINRLLERDGSLKHIERLKSYFGMTKEEILKVFYRKRISNPDLFGERHELVEKVKNPIAKIAELYVSRLKTLFEFVTETPLVLENNHGLPIFHFVCASHNHTAVKIAQDIIRKKQE